MAEDKVKKALDKIKETSFADLDKYAKSTNPTEKLNLLKKVEDALLGAVDENLTVDKTRKMQDWLAKEKKMLTGMDIKKANLLEKGLIEGSDLLKGTSVGVGKVAKKLPAIGAMLGVAAAAANTQASPAERVMGATQMFMPPGLDSDAIGQGSEVIPAQQLKEMESDPAYQEKYKKSVDKMRALRLLEQQLGASNGKLS